MRAVRGTWRCLRHPSMRVWSAANAVSCVGTWMQLVAQNLLVLRLTGSPAVAGVSVAVQAAPGLLLGLAGGAVVDRWSARAVAGVSQALLAGRVRRATVRLALVLAGTAMVCQVAAGLAPVLVVLLAVVAPMAVAESAFDTVTGTLLMSTPHHLRGRVLAARGTASRGWGLAGPVLLGLVLQVAGVRGGLVLGGAVAAVPVWLLVAAAHRRRSRPAPLHPPVPGALEVAPS